MSDLPEWTAEQLGDAIVAGGAVVVDLHAEWCPQCGPQRAVLERVSAEYEPITFGAVDIGQFPQVAEEYEVATLPSLLFFLHGELHDKVVGFARAPSVRIPLDRLVAAVSS